LYVRKLHPKCIRYVFVCVYLSVTLHAVRNSMCLLISFEQGPSSLAYYVTYKQVGPKLSFSRCIAINR